MKLNTLQLQFINELQSHYPHTEIETFFQWLCEVHLGYTRFDISQHKETEVGQNTQQVFKNALLRLQNFEPIQYIIGSTEFYGLSFKVNQHTLIPRPETEELVDWIITDARQHSESMQMSSQKILDIGTGSGCIAISLAKYLKKATVSAIDISALALEVATQNAKAHEVLVSFKQIDVLNVTSLETTFDVIVSNPPYVRELEKEKMQPNVLQHEPEGALFVTNEDPLLFYRSIAQLASTSLTKGGFLYFEINEYLEEEMIALLTSLHFKAIKTKKDIFGKPRMMRCTYE